MIKEISGFEGYGVDKEGNIYSRRPLNGVGQLKNIWRKKQLLSDKDGYQIIGLRRDNKQFNYRVHRLVAQAFCKNFDDKCIVMHLDNDVRNNNYYNLKCGTTKENNQQTFREGRIAIRRGTLSHFAKLNETQVRFIKRAIHVGIPRPYLAKMFNVDRVTVYDIWKERNWKHIETGLLANNI